MAQTDAELAYAMLKERIVTTQMRPGAIIDQATVATELGLGRTPVREAFKRLENERFVVVLPRRGMYVAEVTLAELRELEEVRYELEALSVRLAVRRMTAAQREDMEQALAEWHQEGRRQEGERDRLLEVDRRLHGIIWAASHNTLLEVECRRLFDLSMRMWYLIVDRLQPDDLHEDVFDEILAAISTQDEQRAEDAIHKHVLLFGESLRRHL
jgi:DNA-binding GntR family transcriptional regulator